MSSNWIKQIKTLQKKQDRQRDKRTCVDKAIYATQEEADRGGPTIDSYRCEHCGFWHRTHRVPPLVSDKRRERMADAVLDQFR